MCKRPHSKPFPRRRREDQGLELALISAGSVSALARALGMTSQAINQWRRVPAELVPAVSAATDIPKHKLRPDLHDAPIGAPPKQPGAPCTEGSRHAA